jgi:hypothetical protein
MDLNINALGAIFVLSGVLVGYGGFIVLIFKPSSIKTEQRLYTLVITLLLVSFIWVAAGIALLIAQNVK